MTENDHSLVIGMRDDKSNDGCSYALKDIEVYNKRLAATAVEARSGFNFYGGASTVIGGRPSDMVYACSECNKIQARM